MPLLALMALDYDNFIRLAVTQNPFFVLHRFGRNLSPIITALPLTLSNHLWERPWIPMSHVYVLEFTPFVRVKNFSSSSSSFLTPRCFFSSSRVRDDVTRSKSAQNPDPDLWTQQTKSERKREKRENFIHLDLRNSSDEKQRRKKNAYLCRRQNHLSS